MKKADVYDKLKTVIDPELGINIVELGLIYSVEIKDQRSKAKNQNLEIRRDPSAAGSSTLLKVKIVMTLTTPGCPLSGVFDMMVREAVSSIPSVEPEDIEIQLTFDPPWTMDMMSKEAKATLGFD